MSNGDFFYMRYGHHSLADILDSEENIIGRSELVENIIPFFGETFLRVELEGEGVFKCIFPRFLNTELKVVKDGTTFLSFKFYKNGDYYYNVEYKGLLIQYVQHENSHQYEIWLNNTSIGYIYYYPKISEELLSKKIGTVVFVPPEFTLPSVLFALISKDYYGPMT